MEMQFKNLKQLNCDIWDLSMDYAIVILTNIGWRKDGNNVMGAGLAKQASEKPRRPRHHGRHRAPRGHPFHGQGCVLHEKHRALWPGLSFLHSFHFPDQAVSGYNSAQIAF